MSVGRLRRVVASRLGRLWSPLRLSALLLLLALLAGGVGASTGVGAEDDDAPPVQFDQRLAASIAAAKARAKQAEARRRSPEDKKEREHSRKAFRGKSRAEALDLARDKFGPVISDPLWSSPLRPKDRVVDYVDDHSAILDPEGSDKPALLESTMPLRVSTSSGAKAPVDLDLQETDEGFRPRHAVTDIRFSKRLGDGLALPSSEVKVRRVTSESPSEPARTADKVFWGNVGTDADFMAGPVPAGFETFDQLRSPESPDSLEFEVKGPPGSALRRTEGGGAELVRDGESLVGISAPRTLDAQGAKVPTHYEVAGDRLSIRVDHRGGDFAYPIMVDPTYTENQKNWESNATLDMAGWRFYETGGTYGNFDNLAGSDASHGRGLYISMPANRWFDAYTVGQWRFTAPGDTYVSRTDHTGVDMDQGAGRGCMTAGAWGPKGWEPGTQQAMSGTTGGPNAGPSGAAPWSVCDLPLYNQNRTNFVQATQRGNSSAVWLTPFNFNGAGAARDLVFFGGAGTTITDDRPPRDLRQTGLPSGWVASATGSVHLEANDDGFGMKYVDLTTPGWRSWGSRTLLNATTPCRGDRNAGTSRCPNLATYDASLPEDREGVTEMLMTAKDWLGNTSTKSWNVSVDKTAPTFSLPGTVRPNATLGSSQHQLLIDANDVGSAGATNSGVKKIEYAIDGGTPVAATKTCASGACSHAFTLDTTPGGIAEGKHSIRVRVTDGVGRFKEQTFDVIVDRSAPAIKPLTGTLRTSPYIKAEPYTLDVEATDGTQDGGGAATGTVQAGLESAEVFVNGASVARQTWSCATGSCPQAHTFSIDGGVLPEGRQPVEVVVKDGAGNQAVERFTVVVDRTPPIADVYGPLRQQAGQLLVGPGELHVDAVDGLGPNDPRSGVARIEIFVDGIRRAVTQSPACDDGACPLERDFDLTPENLSGGDHAVRVVATDFAGHQAEESWAVKTEKTPPTIHASGSLKPTTGAWLGPRDYDLNLDAGDEGGSGVHRLEVLVDDHYADAFQSDYFWDDRDDGQPCGTQGCGLSHAFEVPAAPYATGEHEVRVRAIDHHGNNAEERWPVKVDLTPPTVRVSGSLRGAEGQSLTAPVYELSIDAADGDASQPQSGDRSIEVLVDSQRADLLETPCPDGNCGLTRSFTYRPQTGDPNPHEIAVVSTDEAGNVARQTWTVNNPPSAATGGTP